MYSYKNALESSSRYLVFFRLSVIGDWMKFPLRDGVDKIETTHDYALEICDNYVHVRLKY